MLDIPEPSMLDLRMQTCAGSSEPLSHVANTKISWNYVRRQFNFNWAGSHALHACANPEHFVRMGSERGPKCHLKWTTIGPSAKRLWNSVLPACQWPTIECWFGSFVIFRGSGSILLGNPIFLWFFRGGVRTPCPPSGSAHGMHLKESTCLKCSVIIGRKVGLGMLVCPWSGTSDDLRLQTLIAGRKSRERERERLHGVCTRIFCFGLVS